MICLDVDGTIYNEEKVASEATIATIKQLQHAGYKVVIATGRAPFFIEPLLERLGIDSFICLNGQLVKIDGQYIRKVPVPHDALEAIRARSIEHGHPMVFFSDETYKTTSLHDYVVDSLSTLKITLPEEDESFYESHDIYQALLFHRAEEDHLYDDVLTEVKQYRWHEVSRDIVPKEGSKFEGIKAACEHLGITTDEVIAFGDGPNDIEMLSNVGLGVAMGNAIDEVKACSDYVTKSVDDEGITYAVRDLDLLMMSKYSQQTYEYIQQIKSHHVKFIEIHDERFFKLYNGQNDKMDVVEIDDQYFEEMIQYLLEAKLQYTKL